MHLRANMVCDKADDALAVGEGETAAGVGEAFRETVDPETTVGVQHHLDDGGVLEPCRDAGAEGCAQHPRTTRGRLGLERMRGTHH